MSSEAFRPATDLFGYDAPLTWEQGFPLYGVPLTARSNHQRALDLIDYALGPWRALDSELLDPTQPVHFDVIVHDPPGHIVQPPGQPSYRWHGDTFLAVAGPQMLHVDVGQSRATCFVTQDCLEWPEWFRWHVVGAAVLAATYGRRLPLHTATVVRDGLALLLHGRSGTGKSTLTYALTRLGWDVLNDDTQFVSPGPPTRLWGRADRLSLLPDVVRWFPELGELIPHDLANGKRKLVVPLTGTPRLCWSGPLRLCLLQRGEAFAVEPMETAAALDVLLASDEPGFDRYEALHVQGRAALADLPSCLVTLPPDPVAAAEALHRAAADWQHDSH